MALTQISTAGVKDDAVTAGKIPANAVGSSELADNAVDTAAIAADAVTGAKIADDAVTAAKIANIDGNINVNDNVKIRFGTHADLDIYHDGNDSYIDDAGVGSLLLRTTNNSTVAVKNSSANMAVFSAGGPAELYHNGTKKFETTSSGVEVHGEMQMDNANSHIKLPDNARIDVGTGNDLQIYHNGSQNNNWIDSVNNHDMIVRAGTADLYLQASDVLLGNEGASKKYIDCHENGAVELYHNNNKKLETQSWGCEVTGQLHATGSVKVEDNAEIQVGSSADLKLYHDGTESRVEAANGSLDIRTTTGHNVEILANDKYSFWGQADGMAAMYHNGIRKFETYSDGVKVIGVVRGTTSGFGLDFAETSNNSGMNSEVLDDYEEGTFSPTLKRSSSDPSASFYTRQGRYIKIGKLVYCSIMIDAYNVSGGSGQWYAGGFPFNTANASNMGWVNTMVMGRLYFDGDYALGADGKALRTSHNTDSWYLWDLDNDSSVTHSASRVIFQGHVTYEAA